MIDKQYGEFILICDCCGIEHKFETFEEAVKFKKLNGWKSVKVGLEWEDICDSCLEML